MSDPGPLARGSAARLQKPGPSNHATNLASDDNPRQAAGTNRPQHDATDYADGIRALNINRYNESRKDIEANREVVKYMRSKMRGFSERSRTSTDYMIKRNQRGELTHVFPLRNTPNRSGHDLRPRMIREAVPLFYNSCDIDDEATRMYKEFKETRVDFQPVYYTWDEVVVTFDVSGAITNLLPKDSRASDRNFIVRPSISHPGTVCKIHDIVSKDDNDIRTLWEMCSALSRMTGATHAFMETYEPGFDDAYVPGPNRDPTEPCPNNYTIVCVLPHASAHNMHENLEEAKAEEVVPAKDRFVTDFISNDELDVRRNAVGQINDLLPYFAEQSFVNFITTHPDEPGYVVKYDTTAKGIQAREDALSRLTQETGCAQLVGPMVPVPNQDVLQPSEFRWVQTVTFAQPEPNGEAWMGGGQVYQTASVGRDAISEDSQEKIAYYRAGDVDILRDASHQIVDLTPKNPSKGRVNFILVNPDNPGYIAKYDSSANGVRVQDEIRELLGRECGREQAFGLGPVVPVPGQTVDNAAKFQFVQAATFAQLKCIEEVQEEASH